MPDNSHLSTPVRVQRALLGLVVVLVLVAAGFHELLRHPADLLVGFQRRGYNDVTDSILAQRSVPALPGIAGEIPGWNPYALIGVNWVGNPQTAWLYPPNWLYAVLPPEQTLSWLLLLHQLIAAAGVWTLLRFHNRSPLAAAFGGIAYGLAPYLIANIGEGHYNPICSTAWFPWLWLVFERWRAGRAGQWLWIAGLIALCFFCGHQQETFYFVLLMTVAVVIDCVGDLRANRTPAALSRLAIWTGTGLITLGLVAKDLLPIVVYTRNAVRATGLSATDAGRGGIPLYNALQLFAPWAWGNPETYAVPGYPHGNYLWENFTYFGVPVIGLAMLALAHAKSCATTRRWGWIVAVALLFGLGGNTPFYAIVHTVVPGVSFFRAPCRALFIASLGIAILSGLGVDRLLAPLARRPRGMLFATTGSLAVLALIAAIVLQVTRGNSAGPTSTDLFSAVTHSAAPLFWLAAVSLAFAGFAFARSARTRIALVAILFLLTSFELIQTSTRLLATIDGQSIRRTSPAIEFLAKQTGQHRIMARQVLLSDREAWSNGLFKLQGYEPVPSLPVAESFFAASRLDNPLESIGGFHQLDLRTWRLNVLDLLGVRYILLQLNQPRSELLGWKLAWSGRMPAQFQQRGPTSPDLPSPDLPVAIYENPNVLPRAFVLGQTTVVPKGTRPADIVREANPRDAVILSRDLLPLGPRQAFAPATITAYRGSHVTITAHLDAPGYLVLTDAHAPGWSARLDSAPNRPQLPVQSVYCGLRGIPLPKGDHTVTLAYQPPGLMVGSVLSLITAAIAVLIWSLAPHFARRNATAGFENATTQSERRQTSSQLEPVQT